MSTPSEQEFDLEQHFLPAWAKESPAANRYAKYEGGGDDSGGRRGGDRGFRGDRQDRRPRSNRPPGGPGGRPGGPGGRPGERSGRPQRGGDRDRRPQRGDFRREESRPAPIPLPDVAISILPEDKGVEYLARQIKLTGRAYPLFDIAYLILKKPERYLVRFEVIKNPDGSTRQSLFVCNLDDTLWLSEQDAINHVLTKHFDTFYQTERTPTEPPKGTYTFVAQCGMSGVILGPPNYHDYQNKLHKLHTERFSRMPFEAFKSRVKIVRDEAVVKKWQEEQSWKTEFNALNVPEPLKLASREDVEKHFRLVHLANIIKPVEGHSLLGTVAQQLPTQGLRTLYRRTWDEQMKFPIKVVNVLSHLFAGHGLQFFKVNKSVTHTAVARPHYLDTTATPVSEGVQRILDFINKTEKCTRRKILESLAPAPAPTQPAPAAEGAAPAEPVATPEQTAVNADLHWLIHQGHVIEFANGIIETAKKPAPKPAKPAPAKKAAPETVAAATPAVESAESPVEAESTAAPAGETTPAENVVPAAAPEPSEPSTPAS